MTSPLAPWTVSGYRAIRELGTGASGSVILAEHLASGQPVAIKYLAEDLAGEPDFLAGFRAEARLLIEIDDPNVAQLYEYVQSREGAAMVLELVDGVSLRTLLERNGPLHPEAALVVLKGSLLGLASAHDHGVVHRDYKPDNVLVTDDGATKLIDFGIAVRAGRDAPAAGTPAYMAPEQWSGSSATRATDVYAATAVFVECLTGKPPFEGDSTESVRLQHLNAPPALDDVPAALRRLVTKGMAKDPAHRPSDARAFLAALEQAAEDGFGAGWEKRGRRRLGSLALLLVALFPIGSTAAGGAVALALTILSRRRLLAGAAVLGAILLGGTAAATTTGVSGHPVSGPLTLATSSATAAPTRTPTASATATRLPEGRPTPTLPTASATATTHPTTRTSHPPTPATHSPSPSAHPTPTVPPPPPPLTVTIVKYAITQTDKNHAAIYVNVSASDGRPVTVVLNFNDGSSSEVTESGSTSYTINQSHQFPSCGTTWKFNVVTTPGATNGMPATSLEATC